MRFARSTRLAQRRSQRTRQQVAAHAEQDFYDCPRCHNLFPRYHGSHKRHIRSCIAKHEAQVQKEARSRAERVATPTPEPYTPTITDAEMDNEDTSIVAPVESLQVNDAPPSSSPHYSPTMAVGDAALHDTSSTLYNADPATSGNGDGDTANLPGLEALIQTPLQPGKTLIIYHPHAQHPPEIVDTATLSLTREPQPFLSTMPWAPFASRGDFEQAELFIKHNCTNGLINDQLHLNRKRDLHGHGLDDPPLMKNAREMHKILDEAGSDLDISLFEKVSIEVPYVHGGTKENRTYTVYCRSSMAAILDLIEDPDLHPSFTYYPERHYVLNPRTNTNMRVFTDIYTGDDWWELQDKVGPEKVVIQMTLYSDAAKLDKVGRQKAWGVWAWIGNIPRHLRMSGNRKGGAIRLGLLPDVPGKPDDDSSALAEHRSHVYNKGLLEILRSVISAAGEKGFVFNDGTVHGCLGQLIISILAMDYEEVARATTILGANSEFTCPSCLVPKKFLGDIPGNIWPLRTRNGALTLLAQADSCATKTEAYKVLLEQSIRNVPNTLLNYFSHYACVYQAFCSDPLHQIEQGVWGQHFWKWFKEVYLSFPELRVLDEMFKNLPRFPGVHHFHNGISTLQSITADEQSTILRYISPLLIGLCNEEDNEDELLIPAIRSLACLDLLSRFHVHTSDTLSILEGQVEQFGTLTKAIQESEAYKDDKKLSFKWPKMHSLAHLVDGIKRRGPTLNYSTDRGEALHPQNKKYWGRSNRQESSSKQMLHMATESEVIQKLRYQVDNYDEQQGLLQGSEEFSKMASDSYQHILLCSPNTNQTTISAYNVSIHREHGITGFIESLSSFLKRNNLESDLHPYNIIPYHSCRVTYDCQETGSKQTDLFRSTHSWRKEGPRYDSVLVQGQQRSSVFFARVLGLFSLSHHDKTYGLAILQPFIRKHRNKVTGYIELEEVSVEWYELCFIESIIRAVHILPPTPKNHRFIVQDLVDGDAYLRFIGIN